MSNPDNWLPGFRVNLGKYETRQDPRPIEGEVTPEDREIAAQIKARVMARRGR